VSAEAVPSPVSIAQAVAVAAPAVEVVAEVTQAPVVSTYVNQSPVEIKEPVAVPVSVSKQKFNITVMPEATCDGCQ
jgi:hypothetical protein